jgi:hypothetical protein
MTKLFAVAREVQEFLRSKNWASCVIGGIAANHWGEPRVTRDIDVTLVTGFGSEESFIQGLLAQYRPRIPDATEFALRNRVLLLETREGIGIDVALGALPFEESAVKRAEFHEVYPGICLQICTAEDLIVFKSFAARAIDWRDVEAVIARQGSKNLDWKYIERQCGRWLTRRSSRNCWTNCNDCGKNTDLFRFAKSVKFCLGSEVNLVFD